ncbi:MULTISPECIES: NAD-dependent epimerase/dehydratase family protein [unclassified Streptomyces]|uniref:NAD-dependent epimerase/dehydratase family protein n=1 Tax=unclassified Streptomyces TaxID=2593676 RepID=UPI002E20C978|nr:NAD(P)-dependent oxidoreductase [Streptomyces sp. NBC_01023]
MNIVVLGARGFLGKHICRALTDAGERVVPVPAGFDLVTAEPERTAALVADAGADAVVNAAGRAWKADERQMHTGNVELPVRVIRALALLERRPRLVQLGSSHEYGPGTSGAGTHENTEPAPVTPYGRTKLLGARAVLDAALTGGQPGVVLRIANVCGPGTHPGSLLGSVADRLVRLAADRGRTGVPAELRLPPLRAWRDFVDVRDVADAVLRTVRADDTDVLGQVINIGSGTAVHTRDLVNRLIAVGGPTVRVVEESPAGGPSRVDTEWQQLDISRAAEVLGWEPRHSLEQSLRDLLAAA